ncbi:unnamed protein product [Bursaphelenchus xylophilus]|uniref:Probable pectate lyase F n=1 Tax=Bursaphelenchus xylophilus TaxID=6326 RepID=A0A1I7SS56_BURXY|nr:unnamed protein product [Bursaphelenchus xylophilus]CAD5219967.1 unnamed protein product [Bursaphelenchus xylophilus]CAG9105642.1 unnamed protein product [Bursaphelenchus xylophilus]CAG9105646.1 unnamed protein product [Bursaphelenchus xylophilus]
MKTISLTVLFLAAHVSAQFGTWPSPKTTQKAPKTIEVKAGSVFDGKMERYVSGFADGGIEEGQPPIFLLGEGATIQNLVIGAPAADGIHCNSSCKIVNVWWEDVGEDAATFLGEKGAVYSVTGGGAKKAHDKVFQHNGGGTLTIKNFLGEDMGKLYRSCGNCYNNGKYDRHVIIDTVKVTGPALTLAAINGNYGDTAVLKNVQVSGSVTSICQDTQGVNDETLPKVNHQYVFGQDGDGKVCNYKKTDIKKI